MAEFITKAFSTLGFNMEDIQRITKCENVMAIEDIDTAWKQLLEAREKE